MGGTFSSNRKSNAKKVENLYKILGTRSNIGQDRIKEKYIVKLREFPPETHPDEFQEIRRAYETLKDPKKRKQYDLTRKYGDKIDKAMDDVLDSMERGNYEKAKKLIKFAEEIDPSNLEVKVVKAEISIELKEFEQFYSLMDEIIEKCDVEDKEAIVNIKINLLSSKGYWEKALEAVEQGKQYIEKIMEYHRLRVLLFINIGNLHQAWIEIKESLPHTDELTIDDLYMLITWLNLGIELEKWGELSKIGNYIRKLSSNIIEEEELAILKSKLLEEADIDSEQAMYRAADIFLLLLSQVDQKDIYIKERRKKTQELAKLDMEITRATKDPGVFTYVQVKLLNLYLKEYSAPQYYNEYLRDYPHDMMNELEYMSEEIVHGILKIKKKYPYLYRKYKEELTELYNKSTEGLNREQRRQLR